MIVGLVLAGGRSRRFGSDKALAELNGRSLFDATLTVLQTACARAAVSAREGPIADLARARGLEVVADPAGAPDGPLAGLLAGLRWAHGRGADLLATAPCDTPFLPTDLVARLTEALRPDDGAAVVRAGGEVQPLCGVWRIRLIEPLEAMLADGRHPAARMAARLLDGRPVDFPDPAAFFNVNTREDLASAAQTLISRGD